MRENAKENGGVVGWQIDRIVIGKQDDTNLPEGIAIYTIAFSVNITFARKLADIDIL